MKLLHALAPLALLLSSNPAAAVAVALDQAGTLATVASYACAPASQTCDTPADMLSALLTTTVHASDGGIGQATATASHGAGYPTPGSATGTAAVTGGLAVPILKAGAASLSSQWLGGQSLAIQAYTYNGPGETLALGWNLTGSITNPDADSVTGLVVFAGFFDAATLGAFPDVSSPLTAVTLLATLATSSPDDEFRQFTTDGAVSESGSISLAVTPGQQFYLVMGLMAAAGGDAAAAESLSTLTAAFRGQPSLVPTLDNDGTVPLPATAALALLALALMPAARRRRA